MIGPATYRVAYPADTSRERLGVVHECGDVPSDSRGRRSPSSLTPATLRAPDDRIETGWRLSYPLPRTIQWKRGIGVRGSAPCVSSISWVAVILNARARGLRIEVAHR